MKKILLPILLITLLFTACSGNAPATEEPLVDDAATAIAEVLYATQTALASEKEAEVVEVPEAVNITLNTEYTDAAPVQTQLMAGLLMLKDTGLAVNADQASTLLSLLSSLSDANPENTLTDDAINELINQAVAVLSTDQIQAISAMQITQESVMSVLQDAGLEMNAQINEGGSGNPGEGGMGGPGMGGAEGGEPPAGDSGNPDNPDNPDNPGEGGEGGEGGLGGPSDDQEMDRGMMIQPQLIQALMLYLQSVSA